MCSRDLLKRMENYNQGDLTDIIRATSGANPPAETPALEWQFPTKPIAFSAADFGDPFVQLGDPLIHAPPPPQPLPGFFDMIKPSIDAAGMRFGGNSNLGQKISLDEEMKRPPNIFSRMLQISPTAKLPIPLSPCDSSPAAASAPMLVANDHHGLISPSNSSRGNCLIESSLQISSPRNAGIRRRKSQAKKVVCIPAPAPANSRPSGEIVPSDLWAWRKYGQKPIKGSPYPRCSSSKGCLARKQVERSRTDPNMLVITYTSEHNHPWPTQRNALAGSTRSQPSKAAAAAKTSPKPKDEQKETSTEAAAPSSTNSAAVKEEVDQEFDNNNNNNQTMAAAEEEAEFDDGFSQQSYKPALPEFNQNEDSFFAGLGEIEGDSLDLLFTQRFDCRDHGGKDLDPFGFYDWGGTAAAAASSGGAGGEDERDS
ncbi:hypothetical protein SASPL_139580 [Salvia splendens]|uniref:WRKY domain-containing protein n=1 Tax=Salvia splendens TaxID=180675 RepID=A0A8X8ZB50_SALSN|nr:hypothetical protein SASPL_139580 [Salvia splendens]